MSSVGTGTVTDTVTANVGDAANNLYITTSQGVWGSAWAINAYTGERVLLTGLARIIDTFDGQGGTDSVFTPTTSGALIYDTSASGGTDTGGQPVGTTQSFVAIEQLEGRNGNDVIDLTAGPNGSASYATASLLYGSAGNDVLWGGAGNERLVGDYNVNTGDLTPGNDRLHGGAGNDQLEGDGAYAGSNVVLGDDIVDGGTGNDTLYGDVVSYGTDYVGTRGHNTFVFDGPGSGQDIIGDFLVANDKIKLAAGYGYATGAIALAHAADNAEGNAVIDLGNGDKITLGVHAAALTAANFTIAETTAPDTTITAYPFSLSTSASASFSFTGDDFGGSGVAGFDVQLDGGGFFAAPSSPQNYTGLAEGSHTFQVRAVDADGNVDATPASFTWVIDTIAPETTITATPPLATNSRIASFSFTGDDGAGTGIAKFEAQIDGGTFMPVVAPLTYLGLTDGQHTVLVRAIDAAGNVDATPATYTWTVDTVTPETTITTKPSAFSNRTAATFEFTGDDGAGSGVAAFEVRLDGGAFSPTPSGRVEFLGLAQGSHTFEVRAIDAAGNVDTTPASYTWVVDTRAPTVTGVTTTPVSGLQGLGDIVLFTVKFSEAVTVTGAPKLLLGNGGSATFASGSGTDTLVFSYTVATGQSTTDLAVTGSDLTGAGISDTAGNNAVLAGVIGNPAGVLPVDPVGPAVANPIPDQSVAEDTAWSFQLAANAFTDADGDPLTYAASLSDGSALPAWLAFNAATRTFSGTPPLNYNGALDLKVTASDAFFSGSDAFRLTVTPVNDAPVLAGVAAAAGYLFGPTILAPALTISDVDSATLTSATVHVSAGAFTAHGDVLAVSAADLAGTNIVASYNATTETLTLSGTDTLAHYAQALQHVTFETTNLGIERAQTIEWQVNDGAASDNLSAPATTMLSLPLPRTSDFNGNGHSDILWQRLDGTPAIWTVDGTKLVSGSNVGFNPGSDWHEIGTGDFNGDGKSDILWQNTDGTIAEWFLNGTNVISGGNVAFNPGPSWHAIGTGDFNGDGKSDILWQNQDGTPAVWLMNGLNILSGANVGFNPGASWHVVGAGDFNGDGKSDILWQNADGTPAVWLMNGTNLLSGSNVGFNPGAAWHVAGTGDFNGDGKADLLWQNLDGTPAVWLMNGTSLISGANVGFNPGSNWHVIPQDHDLLV
jgi:hypothetical protein